MTDTITVTVKPKLPQCEMNKIDDAMRDIANAIVSLDSVVAVNAHPNTPLELMEWFDQIKRSAIVFESTHLLLNEIK